MYRSVHANSVACVRELSSACLHIVGHLLAQSGAFHEACSTWWATWEARGHPIGRFSHLEIEASLYDFLDPESIMVFQAKSVSSHCGYPTLRFRGIENHCVFTMKINVTVKWTFHFTISPSPKTLCFYNQNHCHRKVEYFLIKEVNRFSLSLLKSFPLYDEVGFDCKNTVFWNSAES